MGFLMADQRRLVLKSFPAIGAEVAFIWRAFIVVQQFLDISQSLLLLLPFTAARRMPTQF